MFKTSDLRFLIARYMVVRTVAHGRTTVARDRGSDSRTIGRANGPTTMRLVVPLVVRPHDRWCDQSRHVPTGCTTLRLVAPPVFSWQTSIYIILFSNVLYMLI
jgi:hypothetical protein